MQDHVNNTGGGVMLQRIDGMPSISELVAFGEGSACVLVEGDVEPACASLCSNVSEGCAGFLAHTSGDQAGLCCLYRAYTMNGVFLSQPGASFYSMSSCTKCHNDDVPSTILSHGMCTPLAIPPTFARSFGATPQGETPTTQGSLTVGLPVEDGQVLFQFDADSSVASGGVVFHFDGLVGLRLNISGALVASGGGLAVGTYSLLVTATLTMDVCREGVASKRDCSTTVNVQFHVVSFINCPSQLDFFTPAQAEPSEVMVQWPVPRVLPTIGGVVVTEVGVGGSQLRIGTHHALYEARGLDIGVPVCEFDVNVHAGIFIDIIDIGVVNNAGDGTGERVYYLIDTLGLTKAKRTAPYLEVLPGQNISVGIQTSEPNPFSLVLHHGDTGRLILDLTWCSSRAGDLAQLRRQQDNSEVNLFTVELVESKQDLEAAGETIFFTVLPGSGYQSNDKGFCFGVRVRSSVITASRSFESVNLHYAHPHRRRRRREDVGEDVPVLLQLAVGSIAAVVVTPKVARDVPHPFVGVSYFAIADVIPPVWVNCPSVPLKAEAKLGANGTAVTWPALMASDAVGMASISSNRAPGDYFTLMGSPHTVSAVATDLSGLQSTCEFRVVVSFAENAVSVVGLLQHEFPVQFTAGEEGTFPSIVQDVAFKRNSTDNTFDPSMDQLSVNFANTTMFRVRDAPCAGMRPRNGDALLVDQNDG